MCIVKHGVLGACIDTNVYIVHTYTNTNTCAGGCMCIVEHGGLGVCIDTNVYIVHTHTNVYKRLPTSNTHTNVYQRLHCTYTYKYKHIQIQTHTNTNTCAEESETWWSGCMY